jgi:hypothetical protein
MTFLCGEFSIYCKDIILVLVKFNFQLRVATRDEKSKYRVKIRNKKIRHRDNSDVKIAQQEQFMETQWQLHITSWIVLSWSSSYDLMPYV